MNDKPRRFNLQETSKNLQVTEVVEAKSSTANQSAPPWIGYNRKWSLTTWVVAAFLALFSFLLLVDFALQARALFELHSVLGYAGLGLAGFFLVLLLSLIAREWRAIYRLNSMAKIQQVANKALETDDEPSAEEAASGLLSLYRKEIKNSGQASSTFSKVALQPLTGHEKLALIDRQVLRKLDKNVQERIVQATRDSAVFTTMSPFALLDALISLWRNLKMIREIAMLYGLAPGWFQTSRLLRRAIGQVVVAGGMEASDGLLNSLFGSSIASKLSAKVGEGLVNGLMTARLGIATAELCRPLPFPDNHKPKLRDLAASAVKRIGRSDSNWPKIEA